jgi:uncharacterized membrane protein YfcA
LDLLGYFLPLAIFMLVLAATIVFGPKRERRKAGIKDWVGLILFFISLLLAFIGGVTGNSWVFIGPAIVLLIISTVLGYVN